MSNYRPPCASGNRLGKCPETVDTETCQTTLDSIVSWGGASLVETEICPMAAICRVITPVAELGLEQLRSDLGVHDY
ncbi:MAG TPA: hypothetical protein VIH90_01420 [Candidatus Saccharimonadales bacterium]